MSRVWCILLGTAICRAKNSHTFDALIWKEKTCYHYIYHFQHYSMWAFFLKRFLKKSFSYPILCSPNHPNCHCHTELLELIITCNNSAFQQWTCRTENSAVLCYLWCSFAKCWFHSEFYFCSQFATFLFWYIILCLVVCNLCVISLI